VMIVPMKRGVGRRRLQGMKLKRGCMLLFERLVSRSGVKERWVSSEVPLVGASIRLLGRQSLNAWSLIRGGRALQPFVYVFDDASMYLVMAVTPIASRHGECGGGPRKWRCSYSCDLMPDQQFNFSDHFIPSRKVRDPHQRPINHAHDQ